MRWLNSSNLLSSYVKWLEAAGAQVVPVIISVDDNEDLTEYFQEVILVLNNLIYKISLSKIVSLTMSGNFVLS